MPEFETVAAGQAYETESRRAGDAPAAARRGRVGGHDRLAQPRLRRRVRRVVRDLRPAAAGGHDRGRRALADAVPDAAGLDGGHDRARGHAGRRRRLRAGAVRRPRQAAGGGCRTSGSPCSGTSRSSSALLEGAMGLHAAAGADRARASSARSSRCPPTSRSGMHLCYGDYGHQHFKQPESLQMQVDLVNAVVSAAQRPLDWASFTVPQARDDAELLRAAERPGGRPGDRALLRARPLPPRRPGRGHDRHPDRAHRRCAARAASGASAPSAGWAARTPRTSRGCSTCTARSSGRRSYPGCATKRCSSAYAAFSWGLLCITSTGSPAIARLMMVARLRSKYAGHLVQHLAAERERIGPLDGVDYVLPARPPLHERGDGAVPGSALQLQEGRWGRETRGTSLRGSRSARARGRTGRRTVHSLWTLHNRESTPLQGVPNASLRVRR